MIENGTADLMRFSGKTVYQNLAKNVSKMYAETGKKAIEPIKIAQLIKRGIEAKYPKARYAASNAKPFLFMRKILSDRLFDKMLMSQMK